MRRSRDEISNYIMDQYHRDNGSHRDPVISALAEMPVWMPGDKKWKDPPSFLYITEHHISQLCLLHRLLYP